MSYYYHCSCWKVFCGSHLNHCRTCNRFYCMFPVKGEFAGKCFGHVSDEHVERLTQISVTSYMYIAVITAQQNNLVEIPEELGLLPFLHTLDLSYNRLGQANDWNWLISPFTKCNLRVLMLGQNGLTSIPKAITELKKLKILKLQKNYLTVLPYTMAKMTNLRILDVSDNKLTTLPSWMYRKEKLYDLITTGNYFHLAKNICKSRPQLIHKEIPSLMQTAAKFLITEQYPFWEYNIPVTLVDYVETAYTCRCGSFVFCDMIGQVTHFQIKATDLIWTFRDDNVVVTLCCHSCNGRRRRESFEVL